LESFTRQFDICAIAVMANTAEIQYLWSLDRLSLISKNIAKTLYCC